MIDLFIRRLQAEERAQKTLSQYQGVLSRFERWLEAQHSLSLSQTDVGHVSSLILTEYYQHLYERHFKVATRNNYVIVVKEFFGFLTDMKLIPEDPSRVLHCVREKKRVQDSETSIYTAEEIDALLSSISKQKNKGNNLRDTAIIALLLGSGLRAFEVCSLNVSHQEGIRAGVISVLRKGGNWEKVNVASFVAPHVDRYLLTRWKAAPDEPLFLSQKGNRVTPNSVWKSIAGKQRTANLPTGIHRFRHTFLTDVDRNDAGNAAISRDLGGHKSVAITNTYLHTTPEERRNVVNSMSYAGLLSE